MNSLFVSAYIDCALFSSVDDNGEPLDANFFESDLAPECREQIEKDCQAFFDACEQAGVSAIPDYENPNYSDAGLSGHDFWLTRNRHGAGYWDRGLGEIGERLTEIAHLEGSADLYVGDDGQIYQA